MSDASVGGLQGELEVCAQKYEALPYTAFGDEVDDLFRRRAVIAGHVSSLLSEIAQYHDTVNGLIDGWNGIETEREAAQTYTDLTIEGMNENVKNEILASEQALAGEAEEQAQALAKLEVNAQLSLNQVSGLATRFGVDDETTEVMEDPQAARMLKERTDGAVVLQGSVAETLRTYASGT